MSSSASLTELRGCRWCFTCRLCRSFLSSNRFGLPRIPPCRITTSTRFEYSGPVCTAERYRYQTSLVTASAIPAATTWEIGRIRTGWSDGKGVARIEYRVVLAAAPPPYSAWASVAERGKQPTGLLRWPSRCVSFRTRSIARARFELIADPSYFLPRRVDPAVARPFFAIFPLNRASSFRCFYIHRATCAFLSATLFSLTLSAQDPRDSLMCSAEQRNISSSEILPHLYIADSCAWGRFST